MPIHHKIRSHQRQRVGRLSTNRRSQNTADRYHKHHQDGRGTRSSRANSELWLDFNIDAPISESDEEQNGNTYYTLLYFHSLMGQYSELQLLKSTKQRKQYKDITNKTQEH